MKKLKDQLPNIDAVEKRLEAALESNLPDFLAATHNRREEVVSARRFFVVALLFSISVIISLYVIRDNIGSWVYNGLVGCAMLWLTAVLLFGRQWFKKEGLLARELNMALVPILSHVLERTLLYTHNDEHKEETRILLKESELITSSDVHIVSDDMYTMYGNNELSFRELLVTERRRNEKGQESQVELFKGVFVVAELPNNHGAKTFISTDNDRIGFAHKTFWTDILGSSTVKETVLEWNDFENHLHVASSDPIVARELITPSFMQDLYDWWLEHKRNIRISFIGNKVFILLPESTIRIGTSTTSTKLKSIHRYTSSLLNPIWRSLTLIEDVSS